MSFRTGTVVIILAATLALAGCINISTLTGASSGGSQADRDNAMLANPPGSHVVPTGHTDEFDLYVFPITHEIFPGASMGMWGFTTKEDPKTATVPGPTLRVTEGDTVLVHFHNTQPGFNHTIHWHGLDVPNDQDGVPYSTQKPVESGQTIDYTFIAKPAGTYWYHCHVDAQHHIDMGMYGVIIVDPQSPVEDPHYDKEFLLELDDMDRYHLEGGQPLVGGNQPQGGDVYSWEDYLQREANDMATRNPAVSDPITNANTPLRPVRTWYPVTYAPYTADYNTYLINGMAFPYTETLVVNQNDTVRLRFVNVGNSVMSMHLHGHHMLVTHKDGVLLSSPYWVDTVLLGPGERYDVYVKMDNPGIWDLHDHIGGHTQNDNIFPGGAMTMLCYQGTVGCGESGGHNHGGTTTTSGESVMFRWKALYEALP
jgi:FtsP/CotA-like multicopper oxidase with cupredoxin domain